MTILSVNPNYSVGPGPLLDTWCGLSISQLGVRDSHAVLQMYLNFSAVLGNLQRAGESVRIVETGSGFSTQIFRTLMAGGSLTSIDYGGREAALNNSHNLVDFQTAPESESVKLVEEPTIGLRELEAVYGGEGVSSWSPLGLDSESLSLFIDVRLDDRRVSQVERAIGQAFDIERISLDILGGRLSESKILKSYRFEGDEFDLLKSNASRGVLTRVLREIRPNLVFLDSGEFSTLPEFLIVDKLVKSGTVLLVQDIIFPKSIKGFLIGALVTNSSSWEVLWIDRSTPQGMLAAVRK